MPARKQWIKNQVFGMLLKKGGVLLLLTDFMSGGKMAKGKSRCIII
jgi:aminoglycoside N3'-acetyltransferase